MIEKLSPETIQSLLVPKLFSENIVYLDETSSTNEVAKRMASDGAPGGTLIIAEYQTRGKGRKERFWESPRYLGIYLSVILRPKLKKEAIPLVSIIASIATAEAVKMETKLDAKIKWPNDILISGKKVSGILIESSMAENKLEFLVIGIGVNVNNEEFRGNYQYPATSLRIEKGSIVSRKNVLGFLLERLSQWYSTLIADPNGKELILKRWRELSHTLGKNVSVRVSNKLFEGFAADIDEMGFLIIKDEKGEVRKISSGEIMNESEKG